MRPYRTDEQAVSPVIAVILLVAITVVMAASVYVFVSGIGSPQAAVGTVSLSSNGATDPTTFMKSWTVSGASGVAWDDITLSVDGVVYDRGTGDGTWQATRNGTTASGQIQAGDTLAIDAGSDPRGLPMRIIHTDANSVMLTITVS